MCDAEVLARRMIRLPPLAVMCQEKHYDSNKSLVLVDAGVYHEKSMALGCGKWLGKIIALLWYFNLS